MKKLYLFLINFILLMLIFTSNVYASTTEDIFIDAVDDLSVEINNILDTNNTSVSNEIDNLISDYERIIDSTTNSVLINKSQYLINSISQTFLNSRNINESNVEFKARNIINECVALFSFCGWKLATELLIYYINNSSSAIVYNPIHWNDVIGSNDVNNILSQNIHSGTGYFSLSEDYNLYFALRAYSFEKSMNYCDAIIIYDTYDFDAESGNTFYSKIINVLSMAEDLGLYIPYGVEIKTDGSTMHTLLVEEYDKIGHTLICENCEFKYTSAHDCIQIGNIFYCSDCPFQGKNLIIGNKLNMKGDENDDDEKKN